jgi:hypothetical protein
MPRTHRSIVVLCIAFVALAAFHPGASILDHAVLEVQWILLPDPGSINVPQLRAVPDEQPLSLLSILPSRGPPASALA